jgi:hypothetical protein
LSGDSLKVIIIELPEELSSLPCVTATHRRLFFVVAIFFSCGFGRPVILQKSFAVCLAAVNWLVGAGFGAAASSGVLLCVPCWCCGAAEENPGIVWAKIQEKTVSS